ncbi:FixH family protein [Herbidospora mongoliensis]|uniref:FixH family protein n=1 Tax=Herbidospora mongoliensis TaxID=688067 RepID=UPI00082D1054|nr:FixH family protein [Herbidospora mongoliensis]
MKKSLARTAAATILVIGALAGCGQSAAQDVASSADCLNQQQNAGLTVQISVRPCPAKGGTATTAQFTIKDSTGAAIKDAAVKINYGMPSMNMDGGQQTATLKGEAYESKLILGMPGYWVLNVQVSHSSGPPAAVLFNIRAR